MTPGGIEALFIYLQQTSAMSWYQAEQKGEMWLNLA